MSTGDSPIDRAHLDHLLEEWELHLGQPVSQDIEVLRRFVNQEDADEIRRATNGIGQEHAALNQSGQLPSEFVANRLTELMDDTARPHIDIEVLPGLGSEESPESAARALTSLAAAVIPASMLKAGIDTQASSDDAKRAARRLLQDDLGSEAERRFISILSAANLQRLRGSPGGSATRPAVITAVVDAGISTAKVSYHVATKRISEADGLEYLSGRAAAAVAHLLRTYGKELVEQGGTALGAMLGSFLGNAPLGAAVGGRLAGLASDSLLQPIEGALSSVTKMLVEICQPIIPVIRGFGRILASVLR